MSESFSISALRSGDVRLFEEIYNTYYPVLYNYALSITKTQIIAEDAVSEVFTRLWEGRREIMIDSSLKSYFFKSVYHQCLNMLKHIRVQNKYREFFLHHLPLEGDETGHPLSGIIENEINVILQKTIDLLPEQCRKIFIMSRIDNMKHEEIAQKLNISINTVRTQIHRALGRLRIELKDFLPIFFLLL